MDTTVADFSAFIFQVNRKRTRSLVKSRCLSQIKPERRGPLWLLLSPTHIRAKELIEDGVIGKILTFKTTFGHSGPETWTVDGKNIWFFDKKQSSFGALADLGVHKTDLILFLTGSKVHKVRSVITTLDKKDKDGNLISVDDNAICIYEMQNGIVGTMTASWTYFGAEDNSTILCGTKGIMYIYSDPKYSIKIVSRDGTKTFYEIDQIQTNDNQTKSGVIDSWVDCLVRNRKPPITGEDALDSMKAIFAVLESAELEKTVVVE